MSNSITVTGAMGGAPQLRFTPNGQAVWNVNVGDTPRRKNQQTGEWEDAGSTTWYQVAVWGEKAEWLAEAFKDVQKGQITFTGRITAVETFEKRDGSGVGVSVKVNADTVTPTPAAQRQQGNQPGGFAQGDPWATPAPGQQQGGWGGQQTPPQGQPMPQQGQPQGGGWGGGAPSYDEPPF